MEAKAVPSQAERIAFKKADLVAAWTVLEKLVVSLRKMGSYYATPDAKTPLPSDRQREMLEALDEYMSPELWRELSHARRLLSEYLPQDELENLSEHEINYWTAKPPAGIAPESAQQS